MEDAPRPVNFGEIKEQWPKSVDGALCARLVCRFLNEMLIQTAMGNGCAEKSPAEASADRTLAMLVNQFRTVTKPAEDKQPLVVSKPLHRFQDPNPSGEPEKKP